jgi:tetratricopeptide (TPR) repeat protein
MKTDFEKVLKTNGGLMSFNNFLSASKDRELSLGFAQEALQQMDTVVILFKMSLGLSVTSYPFACIQEVTYFQREEEILFPMHTVFRIGEIKKLANNSRLYHVDIQLTAIECMGAEAKYDTGWKLLGNLLLNIGQLDKAEELYKAILEQTSHQGGQRALF